MGIQNPMTVSWRESLSVGLDDVDSDHKALFTLIGAMDRAIECGDIAAMGLAMQTLVSGICDHFSREERILLARSDSRLKRHRDSHDTALERFILLRRRFQFAESPAEKCAIAGHAHQFLVQWLGNHIATEDSDLKTPPQSLPAPSSIQSPAPPGGGSWPEPKAAGGEGDVDYALPPHLAHLLQRLSYETPRPGPAARGFKSFEQLCGAAIQRRVDAVLLFFQRSNPAITRGLPPPFIASPDFAHRFAEVVERLILPTMLQSRQLRLVATHLDWQEASADVFWTAVDPTLAEDMLVRWRAAWDDLKLVSRLKEDGTRVLQVKPATKILREMLSPVSPHDYDLPRIGNVEIAAFRTLFDPLRDLTAGLEAAWRGCHDLYEQELDPRMFQQRARDGALRDYLLSTHGKFSDHWGEFLVLTCHRVFGRVTTRYLERFSLSLGRTPEERHAHMPFLISYLSQLAGHPHIRRAERDAEDRWQAGRQELQKVLRGLSPGGGEG